MTDRSFKGNMRSTDECLQSTGRQRRPSGKEARLTRERRRTLNGRAQDGALILAAGRGSRLGMNTPKCLVEIDGEPLISRQLDMLEAAGMAVTVVAGFQHERVREAVAGRARIVLNQRFAETNSLYSFHLAREAVEGDAVVMNADVLFDPDVLDRVRTADGCALAYDSQSGMEPEHMKVFQRDGALVEMRKDLPLRHSCGENVGLLRFDRGGLREAFEAAARIVAVGGEREWLASAINQTAWRHRFECIEISDLPWIEIDFPEDLEVAREQVWHEISAAQRTYQDQALVAAL